jgi:hypothetical protein
MRGRKPRRVSIANGDISTLQQVARSRMLPWFQVQRARVILAMADGERVQTWPFKRNVPRLPSGGFVVAMNEAALKGCYRRSPERGIYYLRKKTGVRTRFLLILARTVF